MATDEQLIDGLIVIIHGHHRMFSGVKPEEWRPLATLLLERIRAGESEMALHQLVATEEGKLYAQPPAYKEVVAQAVALIR